MSLPMFSFSALATGLYLGVSSMNREFMPFDGYSGLDEPSESVNLRGRALVHLLLLERADGPNANTNAISSKKFFVPSESANANWWANFPYLPQLAPSANQACC